MNELQNVAVVGGSGFIGTRLCQRFSERNGAFNFAIIDKVASKDFPEKSVQADIRSNKDLDAVFPPCSALIHLAAEHRDDIKPVSLYHEVNVDGARNICDIAKKKGVKKIVFTSSVAVYGFAPVGTNEEGDIAPFNEYGRSKFEAEQIFKAWQKEDVCNRTLVIVRPTVVFGERNRGNVFNLLRQIARGQFVMIGNGKNRKSMAYVENVAAFLEYALSFNPGLYIYNYIDKPDFTMNQLVTFVRRLMGKSDRIAIRLPYTAGRLIGQIFDLVANLTGKRFTISAIRVKKFCANSVYNTGIERTGFITPVPLTEALSRTIKYEFLENNESLGVFYTE